MMLDDLLRRPDFTWPQARRDAWLGPVLSAITAHHRRACPPYDRWVASMFGPDDAPFLPVGVFKTHDLRSVPEDQVVRWVTSSGTGGAVSRVALDAATADRQSRALAGIMQMLTGPRRLPMLLIESERTLRAGAALNARAAAVVGMMRLGRDHLFALDADMNLRTDQVADFALRHAGAPVLLFGFTFIVWSRFLPAAQAAGLRFDDGLLIHGGGWKALTDQAVDNACFKREIAAALGVTRVRSYYGMAEQVGSVFIEGDDGLLHPPPFADVIVRDPQSWEALPTGRTGVLQVVSALPHSYPGHSLLTEDVGTVHAVDCGPWGGKAFSVQGRLPKAEMRGCSDVQAAGGGR